MMQMNMRSTAMLAALLSAAISTGCRTKLLGLNATILVSPDQLAFGPIAIGTPQQIRVSVSDTGGAPLLINAIKINGDPNHELAVTGFVSDCADQPRSANTTLAPGECARFSVNWSPTTAHAASGSIEIDSTDLQNPIVTLPVSGMATAPLLQVCVLDGAGMVDPAACSNLPSTIPTVNFSSAQTGQPTTRTLRVLNKGTGALSFHSAPKISSSVGTPSAFSLSGAIPGNTLASGASADLTLTAASSTNGALQGELDISSTDLLSPQLAVPLQVLVAEWKVCIEPAGGLAFGAVILGQTQIQQLTLTNCGSVDLTVASFNFQPAAPTTTQLAITAGMLPAPAATFAAGAKIVLGITYAPTVVQSDQAAINYLLNFESNPLQGSIPISGSGVTCDGNPGSPVANACGICGGPAVSNLGGACTASSGCTSVLACNASGTGTVCTPAPLNACGGCAALTQAPGGACTAAPSGCASTLECNATGNGTQCTPVAQNACGVCGGAQVSGVGQSCSSPNGCTATGACSADGLSLTCNAPAFCDLATHVVFSQLTGYGPSMATSQAGEYDEFVELYNPTASAIDISGYTLWYRISDKSVGFWSNLGLVGTAGQTIAAHGYWLGIYGGSIGTTYTGTASADFQYSTNTTNLDRSHGQLALWLTSAGTPTDSPKPTDTGFVDFVGYGNTLGTATGEIAVWDGASPAPGPAVTVTASIMRKAFPASTSSSLAAGGADAHAGNGVGTDNNGFDWVPVDPRNPRNSRSPTAP